MARSASGYAPVRQVLAHALRELAVMRVRVAPSTSAVVKAETDEFRVHRWIRLVTLDAWHRQMTPGKREVRLLMPGNSEACGLEALNRVAGVAAFLVWRGRELSLVRIGVAVGAGGVLHLVHGSLARGDMAFGACNRRMFAFERVASTTMIGGDEARRLESFHRVARGAVALVGATSELPVVLVLVTIQAVFMSDGFFEVRLGMAFFTAELRVFAGQRKVSLGVIEIGCDRDLLFPPGHGMAGFAGFGERAMMQVAVAVGTALESQSDKLDRRRRIRWMLVTLGALQLRVRAFQLELGRLVIKA